jgi:hypothetical protein
MAKQKNTEETATTVSEAAAATRAAIGDRPRQSQVRLVEYFRTIRDHAADRLDEFWSAEEQDALNAVADKVEDKVQIAATKAEQDVIDRAIKNLENHDEKNGYANFAFDPEVFELKTKEKTPRTRRSPADKVAEALTNITPEQEAELLALLQSRGLVNAG